MPIAFVLLFLASPVVAAMALETEQFVLFLVLFVLTGLVSADRLASVLPSDEPAPSPVDAGRTFAHTRRGPAT